MWWSGAGDPRAAITLAQLLHIKSNFEFAEQYANPLADVTWMLFGTGDAAAFAAAKPLAATPGTRWSYSSGTSNILGRVLREAIAFDAEYLAFPRHALWGASAGGAVMSRPGRQFVAPPSCTPPRATGRGFGAVWTSRSHVGRRAGLPDGSNTA